MTPQQVAEKVREARETADPSRLDASDVCRVLSRVIDTIRGGGVMLTTDDGSTLNCAIYLVTKYAVELAIDRRFEELTKYGKR